MDTVVISTLCIRKEKQAEFTYSLEAAEQVNLWAGRKEAEESSVHGLPRPPEAPEESERKAKSPLSANTQLFSFIFHLEFIKLKFVLKFHKS